MEEVKTFAPTYKKPGISFPVPSCRECRCPHYVNNWSDATYVPRAKGRTLYRKERYCLHGKRAVQFKKADSILRVPGWCPIKKQHPAIRCYTRRPETYFEQRFGLTVYYTRPEDYILAHTTNTFTSPRQFYMKLRKKDTDYLELMGWYPKDGDVIEIDIGVTQFYLHKEKKSWRIIEFDAVKCDHGQFGRFTFVPHQELEPNRYSDTSLDFRNECIGVVNGYFAAGRFRSQWSSNDTKLANEERLSKELEDLLFLLQNEGFLKGPDDMDFFCYRRPWSRLKILDFKAPVEFGFYAAGECGKYYFRLNPDENSSINVRIFCYPPAAE